MQRKETEEERARVNPAARKDRPGEPHEDLARTGERVERPAPKGYQDAEPDARDAGGIGG